MVATIEGGDLDPASQGFRLIEHTPERLGLGSNRNQIIAAYGPPELPVAPPETGEQFCSYPRRGIEFKLRDNVVVFLTVRAAD